MSLEVVVAVVVVM